ncbi:MAG TPA: NAD-dependent epimerase/dehydratase family protein [Candidatus Lumbricidophila sp.]|nr:NAD-dependent epimerase/dehydratase family protein [Candidatus Lumbricidophila sp.]
MARVAVIGANGFIGSHLVDALSGAGHQVRAFDRYSSRQPTFLARDTEIVRGEFLSRADLDSVVEGMDYVFHFLSTTTPATAAADPTLDVRTNLAQTIELLEACVHAGVRRVFYASTGGAIYGNQEQLRFRESDPTYPVSPYAIGKLAVEHYLRFFSVVHGLPSTVFRISNPYGTRQHPYGQQGLIPIAIGKILRGEPVVQLGDGSMVRDYLYVEDLVGMILSAVDREPKFDVYNLGSGEGYTVTDVLNALRDVSGIDFEIDVRPVPPTFVDHVVLDVDRFTGEFDSRATTSLVSGIRATFDHMKAGVA